MSYVLVITTATYTLKKESSNLIKSLICNGILVLNLCSTTFWNGAALAAFIMSQKTESDSNRKQEERNKCKQNHAHNGSIPMRFTISVLRQSERFVSLLQNYEKPYNIKQQIMGTLLAWIFIGMQFPYKFLHLNSAFLMKLQRLKKLASIFEQGVMKLTNNHTTSSWSATVYLVDKIPN